MDGPLKKLLLVEDEALTALNTRMQLEKIGYAVDHVLTGEAAVTTALNADSPPDLILMDIDLGKGIDGTQAAEQILNGMDIPVVFLSSHTEPKIVEKTEKITSYGYVVKNSGLTVLDASIKMAFKLFEAKMHEQRHKADLLHSRDFMRYIIEHNRGAVAVHDRDLKYIYVSKQYLDQYNVQEREVIGKHHYEVFPDLPQKFRDAHQRALRGEASTGENDPYQHSDGTTVWTRWECLPWYEADSTIGGFIVYTEVLSQESTERVATRDALNYLRSILRTTRDGFAVVDMDGHFLDVNDAACTMWGYPRDEFLKLSISDIDPEHNPERTAERIQKIRSTGYARFETGNRRKDGTVFYAEVSASFLGGDTDSIIAFYRDITDRKQAEENSREQGKQFEAIFENSLNPIVIADDAGNYLKVNEAAAGMFNYPVEKMTGMNVGDLQTTASPHARDRYQEYLKRGYDVGEFEFVRSDGSHVTAQYHAIRVRDNFNVSILSDITERKLAEEEIQRQLADKETLFKEVHHRIKNNMAQIESLLAIQANSAESADVKSALETAMSRVRSTRILYEKLLVGKGHEEVSVKDYLESLIESHIEVYNDNPGVSIGTRIDDFAVSTKTAIPIGIIVNELLTNVFKYAFGDRVAGHVRIGLQKDGKQVTLNVQDNGVGFDLRVAANKSTGFGLSLTKMLAEQLDGTFTVERDNGTRSTVTFEV